MPSILLLRGFIYHLAQLAGTKRLQAKTKRQAAQAAFQECVKRGIAISREVSSSDKDDCSALPL